MRILRAIVIDDEEPAIQALKILGQRHPNLVKIVASAVKPLEGIMHIENYRPDVVFLDISMPEMNGFDLLSRLSQRDFKLVFTTAHKEYALAAIKNRAFEYLLKPIDEDDFRKCLEELQHGSNPVSEEGKAFLSTTIEVQVKNGIIFIKQKEIVRIESSRNYTVFYLDNGTTHIASKNMGHFEVQLDPKLFYRCHKSHIVNLQKVQRFINHDGLFALMCDGSTPDISKNNKDEFLQKLKLV